MRHPNIRLDFILATRNVLHDAPAPSGGAVSRSLKRFKQEQSVVKPNLQRLVSCSVDINNVTNVLSDHYPVSLSLLY